MRPVILIRYSLVAIGISMLLVFSANACPFEKFADSPHIKSRGRHGWWTRGAKHVDLASVAA